MVSTCDRGKVKDRVSAMNMIDADSKEACPFNHFMRSGHLDYATGIPINSVGLQNRPIWVKFGSGEPPRSYFCTTRPWCTGVFSLHCVMHVLFMMPCMQHEEQQTVADRNVQLDHITHVQSMVEKHLLHLPSVPAHLTFEQIYNWRYFAD